MIQSARAQFADNPSLDVVRSAVTSHGRVSVHGLSGSSAAFLTSAILEDGAGAMLAVLPTEEEAEDFRDDLEAILGRERVRYFPERDTNPYEHADSHVEVRSRRVETLDALERGWSGIVVASAAAVHEPATPPGLIPLVGMEIRTGMELDFDDVVRSLVEKGFKRVNTVNTAGEIAVRGGIIDVFPFGDELPRRVEFWGDTVESIRTFSVSSQRSVETVHDCTIVPPDEFVTEAGMNAADERRLAAAERADGISLDRIRRVFEGGDRPNGVEQYLYLVFGERASLTGYFDDSAMVFLSDPQRCREHLDKRLEHIATAWERQRNDDSDIPSPEHFIERPESFMHRFGRFRLIENHYFRPRDDSVEFAIGASRQYQGDIHELTGDIRDALGTGMTCFIACDNAGQADRMRDLLAELADDCTVGVARLTGGFVDRASGLLLLTDHEIFSRYGKRRVRYSRYRDGAPIPDYRALRIGDFVVHVDYGIGRFQGIKHIDVGGAVTDCLLVKYRGDDELFVPVHQLKRLKKFTVEEGAAPVVTKLGGTAWEKLKERTRTSIKRMARDLLRLYAERKAYPGHSFNPDRHMLDALVDSFVYEDTRDQRAAWNDVMADMGTAAPMDRLLCGDVGFGKTEVAVRAAYMAVLDGKQVAVLVPTTILADQHEETFRERFADFPVSVESLSRFKSRKEQKDILDRVAAGRVDVIIGTHRLLSKDVYFKDLGLLVVDEEQRFGVRHKERIKHLRSHVDVLSMSATPIPRTLNLSLSGARDISFITTPPSDRYSVHTEILPFNEKDIVEAVMREIDRGGQVYFVHNRVRSIDSVADYLRRLMPAVSFAVGHGKLPERELERIIHDFHHGKFQVLVSTMIIENGLDIPSVNTIIINRADTFGLSQLYQLRGRVGRSNRRAYAYLLVPPKVALNRIARQRLRIIEEFAELGSGFKIAMRDLEIRGAGNILGTEQSGFMAAVGFELYNELLNETIAELKGEKVEKPPEIEVKSGVDTYIPESYIPDSGERVVFYRRLAEAVSAGEVEAVEEEFIDRFGRPPAPARNLLDTAYIRHHAAGLSVNEISIDDGDVIMFVPKGVDVTRDDVERLVKTSPVRLDFSFAAEGMNVRFEVPPGDGGDLAGVKKVLQTMRSGG